MRYAPWFQIRRLAGLPALLALLLALGLLLAQTTHAATASVAAADPLLEKRVMALSEQLRCLVCQNQTIADSHADLAVDLRNQVREKLQSGWDDGKVLDFMVERYGDFVLYKPPVRANTWLLWFGPFVLFFLALALLFRKLKRQVPQQEPDAGQLQQAASLLAGTAGLHGSEASGTHSSGSNKESA